MTYNACVMDSSKPVTRLATSVWSEANEEMKAPLQFLPKSSIPKDKEEIYNQVADVCIPVVEAIREKQALEKF